MKQLTFKRDISPHKPISCAEFARRLGCDESTVRRYVKAGKIHGTSVAYKPSSKVAGLLFDLAKPQYSEARALVEHRFAQSGGAPTGKKTACGNPAPIGGGMPSGASTHPLAGVPGKPGNLSEAELSQLELNQLVKREIVLRILIKRIEIKKELDILVNVADVWDILARYVPLVRKRIESIPDRLVDKLLAADSRHEALRLFLAEVNYALIELSNIGR